MDWGLTNTEDGSPSFALCTTNPKFRRGQGGEILSNPSSILPLMDLLVLGVKKINNYKVDRCSEVSRPATRLPCKALVTRCNFNPAAVRAR